MDDSKKTVDQWAAAKKVEAWKVAGAKALKGWDEHFQISESAFDEAVDEVANIKLS